MDTMTLSGAVGARPAANHPADVKTVQALLLKVAPPLAHRVTVTGVMDHGTTKAIHEFQSRFMSSPDGRVDPDRRTLWHLNEGFVSKYVHCSAHQRLVLDRDLMLARDWLRGAVSALDGTLTSTTKGKLKNIFHVDAEKPSDRGRLSDLKARFIKLKGAMDEPFSLECHTEISAYGAWVVPGSSTMHFPANHFAGAANERVERFIHERSHTVFAIVHAGMPPSGSLDFGKAQDDDNGFTYEQAIANAYCYGWFTASVQPGYVPDGGGMIVTPPSHRH